MSTAGELLAQPCAAPRVAKRVPATDEAATRDADARAEQAAQHGTRADESRSTDPNPACKRVLARSDWDPVDGCLLWSGPLTRRGYSVGSLHRVVYTALVGPIPTGWTIDHDCHTRALAAGACLGGDSCLHRACVNVDHLVAMTIGDNVRAGNGPAGQHARQVECLRGHPFDARNTVWRPNGSRSCHICDRDRARAYYVRRTAAARQVAPGAIWEQADLLEGTS